MKQKDLTTILLVIFISGIFSFVLSNYLFASPKNRHEKVEVVKPITAEFKEADKRYFNEQSVNPTQLITIGDNNNTSPFKTN
jgi:hypothetical protein